MDGEVNNRTARIAQDVKRDGRDGQQETDNMRWTHRMDAPDGRIGWTQEMDAPDGRIGWTHWMDAGDGCRRWTHWMDDPAHLKELIEIKKGKG